MGWGTGNIGGGGAALNFKVVPGLTQPGTASENTIWVKTERIGAWYFSATQPENMQEWDVWFEISTESDYAFNALRKSGLQVYPQRAMQYVDGNLVSVETMIYQGGEWVQWWNGELYVQGDECESVTGGWYAATYSGYTGTLTKDSTSMTLSGTYTAASAVCVNKKETPIDFSGYNICKINVTRFTAAGTGGNAYLAILNTNKPSDWALGISNCIVAKKEITQAGVFELDISSIDDGYPAVIAYLKNVTFDEIILK